jgi:hypothetical protein
LKIFQHASLNLFQTLSLDVVAGALASGFLATKIMEIEASKAWYIVLGFAVWAVYTLDHLLDGSKLKEQASSPRHRFHFRKQKPIALVLLLVSLSALLLAFFFLDKRTIYFGFSMGIVVGIYIFLVSLFGRKKRNLLPKEIVIALIYATGIWGGPMLWLDHALTPFQISAFLIFLILAFANTSLLAFFQIDDDRHDKQISIATSLGSERIKKILFFSLMLAVFGCLLAVFLPGFESQQLPSILIMLCISTVMLLVLIYKKHLEKGQRYKLIIELSFSLSFLLLFFQH